MEPFAFSGGLLTTVISHRSEELPRSEDAISGLLGMDSDLKPASGFEGDGATGYNGGFVLVDAGEKASIQGVGGGVSSAGGEQRVAGRQRSIF